MKCFAVLLVVAAFLLETPLGSASEPLAGSRPNVVLVITDDQGYGPVGRHGHPWIKTPHLDKMAAEGMRFTQHYAGDTVCADGVGGRDMGSADAEEFIRRWATDDPERVVGEGHVRPLDHEPPRRRAASSITQAGCARRPERPSPTLSAFSSSIPICRISILSIRRGRLRWAVRRCRFPR